MRPVNTPMPRALHGLTVLFDDTCAFCVRCQAWLGRQRQLVPLELLARDSAEAHLRYGALGELSDQLVVVSDAGDVWVGPDAFTICLWALAEYRGLAGLLTEPPFSMLAARVFRVVSAERRHLAAFLRDARCTAGACRLPHHDPYR